MFKSKLKSVKQDEKVESPLEKLKRLENGKNPNIYVEHDKYIFEKYSIFTIGIDFNILSMQKKMPLLINILL